MYWKKFFEVWLGYYGNVRLTTFIISPDRLHSPARFNYVATGGSYGRPRFRSPGLTRSTDGSEATGKELTHEDPVHPLREGRVGRHRDRVRPDRRPHRRRACITAMTTLGTELGKKFSKV